MQPALGYRWLQSLAVLHVGSGGPQTPQVTEPPGSKAGSVPESPPGAQPSPPAPVGFPGGCPALPLSCCCWGRWLCPVRREAEAGWARAAVCFLSMVSSRPGWRWAQGQVRRPGGLSKGTWLSTPLSLSSEWFLEPLAGHLQLE